MTRRTKPRESIVDGIQREAAEETAREMERRKLQLAQRQTAQLAASRQRIAQLETLVADQDQLLAMLSELRANPLAPTAIESRERRKGGGGGRTHEATAVLLLSDLHLEETVEPAEVNGINEYNLAIAAARMERLAVGLVWMLELCRAREGAGYAIHELVLDNMGDITTNYLRAEDMHGNELTPMEAIVFAVEQLGIFTKTILARCPWIKRVRMPVVPGNHDRMSFTPRTPFRKRVGMSSAPLLAYSIGQALRDEPRFSIELSPSEHHYLEVYGHLLRSMHGDRFRYAGGVGGIFIPARRHIAQLNKARHAHVTVFGHWHTARVDDLWISNGSLIGPNAYSTHGGLDPEPPAQVFFLLDRDRGKRIVTPIQVSDHEGWS